MIPKVWSKAIIAPIPKGGDKDPCQPLNYRGISLLSCVGKLFTYIINNRIVKYCEMLNLLHDKQNGFRCKRSCVDHLFSISSIIRNRLNQSQNTYVAFIDMEKAFDWTDRNLLLYRLLELNIDGKLFNIIKSFYTGTISKVKLGPYVETDWFNVPCGVRQGDPLSTTLFNLYINTLIEDIKDSNIGVHVNSIIVSIFCYADDIILLAPTEKELQALINILNCWTVKWRMKVNVQKSNIIHFRKKRQKQTTFNFKLGSFPLSKISEYKYLGFFLQEHLDFNVGVRYLTDAASRATGALISKFKTLKNVGFDTFKKLYFAGVAPILEYSSEVWGYNKFSSSDQVQNRAFRYFLGVHKFAPTLGIMGDTGCLSTRSRRHINMIRFWNKLLKMKDDRLTKQIFLWDLTQPGDSWSNDICNIFKSINLESKFDSQTAVDISQIEQLLKSNSEDMWLTELINKPKLRTYILFKNTLITENMFLVIYLVTRDL